MKKKVAIWREKKHKKTCTEKIVPSTLSSFKYKTKTRTTKMQEIMLKKGAKKVKICDQIPSKLSRKNKGVSLPINQATKRKENNKWHKMEENRRD